MTGRSARSRSRALSFASCVCPLERSASPHSALSSSKTSLAGVLISWTVTLSPSAYLTLISSALPSETTLSFFSSRNVLRRLFERA